MKLKLMLLAWVLCALTASAQDIIHLTDGTAIKAKVTEITDTEVKYRKFTNPAGPVYTVMRDKINKIVYENGETDLINGVTPSQVESQGASEATVAPNRTELNEYELLRIAETEKTKFKTDEAIKYEKTAKKYRRIAWIGGLGIAVAGTLTCIICWPYPDDDPLAYGVGIPLSCAVGAGWCVGWNIAANKMMNKARLAETYSAPVAEIDLVKFGKSSLRGSVNLMGNQLTRNHAVGLGLTLSL